MQGKISLRQVEKQRRRLGWRDPLRQTLKLYRDCLQLRREFWLNRQLNCIRVEGNTPKHWNTCPFHSWLLLRWRRLEHQARVMFPAMSEARPLSDQWWSAILPAGFPHVFGDGSHIVE